MLVITDAATIESITPRMQRSAAGAREAEPGHPLVGVLGALDLLYPEEGADFSRGLERMDDAIAALAREEGAVGRFWHLLITNFRAQALLSRGAIVEAHETIRGLLDERPDYWLVRETLLPMTAPARVADPPQVAETAWKELARDARGDGRSARLPDARSLSYYHETGADWLWFRIGLYGAVDPASIGINLPVDVDGSQETGNAWWGGNTAFRWDRLVTVWIARTGDGRYRGATGIGDTRGAAEGRYVNLASGNVVTAFDETSLYIGFPRADLTEERRLNLIGVVGSSTRWNDPLPDNGQVTIDLDDR